MPTVIEQIGRVNCLAGHSRCYQPLLALLHSTVPLIPDFVPEVAQVRGEGAGGLGSVSIQPPAPCEASGKSCPLSGPDQKPAGTRESLREYPKCRFLGSIPDLGHRIRTFTVSLRNSEHSQVGDPLGFRAHDFINVFISELTKRNMPTP